jgi:hypothetical protein
LPHQAPAPGGNFDALGVFAVWYGSLENLEAFGAKGLCQSIRCDLKGSLVHQ